MSQIALSPNAAGTATFTIAAPATNTNRTLTLPDAAGSVVLDAATQTLTNKTLGSGVTTGTSLLTLGTAQNSTSGTAIDFTGIPSWVRRVTVMFNGVSTNGTSSMQVQLGAGAVQTSGYTGARQASSLAGNSVSNLSAGFTLFNDLATHTISGIGTFTLLSGNTWAGSISLGHSDSARAMFTNGSVTLSDTLDRIRITTVNGTDTFDAGSINIMWE